MSNSVFIVIVVGIVLAMLVMMVRYARFIHNYPAKPDDETSARQTGDTKHPDSSGQEE